jgi:MFS family permease
MTKIIGNITSVYRDYPKQFWILTGASFIDLIGVAVLGPFFMLYITQKFGITMAQAGLIFGVNSIINAFGSTIGGALADNWGRKKAVIYGLVLSAFGNLALGLIDRFDHFVAVMVTMAIFGSFAGPARAAMIGDILPKNKRAEGFAIYRVAFNLAFAVGPAMAGFLAARSYFYIFMLDVVLSLITAVIVALAVKESLPEADPRRAKQTFRQSLAGYGQVLRDRQFLAFALVTMLTAIMWRQIYATFGVFMRDVQGLAEQNIGFLLSLNGGMVVLFQIPITRALRSVTERVPMRVIGVGIAVAALGMMMFSFTTGMIGLAIAMIIHVIGEMIAAPHLDSLVIRFAPEDKRARYIAVFNYRWMLVNMFAPYLSGRILDSSYPIMLYYVIGAIGLIATVGFFSLERILKRRDSVDPAAAPAPG